MNVKQAMLPWLTLKPLWFKAQFKDDGNVNIVFLYEEHDLGSKLSDKPHQNGPCNLATPHCKNISLLCVYCQRYHTPVT